MKRCMYCGHENEDAAATCSVCGNKLGVSIPTVDSVVEEVSLDEAADAPAQADAAAFPCAEALLRGEYYLSGGCGLLGRLIEQHYVAAHDVHAHL